MQEQQYTAVIAAFHQMWDGFPGIARLIRRDHVILASNPAAAEKGFVPGAVCARVGAPETHRGCKMAKCFATGQAQTDRVLPDRIRGWLPVEGQPELLVHFAIFIPEA